MSNKGQYAKFPFISGDNLNEATPFTPTTTSSTNQIRDSIISNCTTKSDGTADAELAAAADSLLQLYADDPVVGSPSETGNETFGFSSQYKRNSALTGDLMFHSVRRLWTQKAVQTGVKAPGYLFTGPRPVFIAPNLGAPLVPYGLELDYLFGRLSSARGSSTDIALADKMMDYWISFATSLDLKDGKGTPGPVWPEYTASDAFLLQLNANDVTTITDAHKNAGIEFMYNNVVLFRH
ncbi:hypothetical protein PQX77_020837 [Marasmius sp. AFHP31]|nr:hypothetical protein PQX77_020837 [Marasmius sp. AFHP31]